MLARYTEDLAKAHSYQSKLGVGLAWKWELAQTKWYIITLATNCAKWESTNCKGHKLLLYVANHH